MNDYNIGRALGLFFGAFIGLVIAFILIRLMRNGRTPLKGRYDERQNIARGKAYMYAFYTLLIGNAAIFIFYPILSEYISPLLLFVIVALIGVTVYACNCILNDAYFALNDKPRSFMFITAVLSLINLVCGVVDLNKSGIILTDNYTSGIINILCAGMFIVIFFTLLIKQIISKNDD